MISIVDMMRQDGYPYKIKGNAGETAVLCDKQSLTGGDYVGIYRYNRGTSCHDLDIIKQHFEVLEM